MRERKLKLSINRNLALALMFFLILPALIAGYTYAIVYVPPSWFTDEAEIDPNIFTAGTLLIDANNTSNVIYDSSNIPATNEIIMPGGYVQSLYTIKNTGTKTAYLRAYFKGYWETIYHKNTVTVIADPVGSVYGG